MLIGGYGLYFIESQRVYRDLSENVEGTIATVSSTLSSALKINDIGQIVIAVNSVLIDPAMVGVEVTRLTKEGDVSVFSKYGPNFTENQFGVQSADLIFDGEKIGTFKLWFSRHPAEEKLRTSFAISMLVLFTVMICMVGVLHVFIQQVITQRLFLLDDYLRSRKDSVEGQLNLISLTAKDSQYRDEIDRVIDTVIEVNKRFTARQDELLDLKIRAEKANELKSLFLASMSHELRTPLNAILGAGELMVSGPSTPEERAEYVALQAKAGQHLRHLIEDILDLSKIESGQLNLDVTNVDLHSLIKTSVKLVEHKAYENKNELICQIEDSVPHYIKADAHRLMQVIFNIIGNACKFTENGRIIFNISSTDEQILFTFKDTGLGIDPKYISDIFFPFQQLANTGAIQKKGAGIGLAVCRGIADKMGGRIEVESEPGVGSIFKFQFPLVLGSRVELIDEERAKIQNPSDDEMMLASSVSGHTRSLRILVAEDTEENIVLMKAFLKKEPYQIDYVRNGREAVQSFKNQNYDLVLMDLQMPEMDGYQATSAIRHFEHESGRRQSPIVAVTAYASSQDLERSIQVGCNSFLTKPFRKEALIAVIKKYSNSSYTLGKAS